MHRLLYILLLVSSSVIYANDTNNTMKPPADILLPDDMKGQIVSKPPMVHQSDLSRRLWPISSSCALEYSAQRHAWRFGYNEVETMKGINHLISLIGTAIQYGEKSPEGSEAFYMMKQPLQYVSQFLALQPIVLSCGTSLGY